MPGYIPYEAMMARLSGPEGPFEEMRKFPERFYVHPVRIIKDLYYVGDKAVCMHLIDTGDGLILIDGGYPTNRALLVNAIWEAGFNPNNIKYLILTHEHYDHFGAADFFRTMYGCKIVASAPTADVLQNHPERAMIDNQHTYLEPCKVDVIVNDGDVLELGSVKLKMLLTPGHGEGVLTFLFDMTDDDGKTYRCALFGGATTVTMYKKHLKKYGIRMSILEDFPNSLKRLHSEKVDIVLGNHPRQNDTLGKIARMKDGEPNPWIDPTEWDRFLDNTLAMFRDFEAQDID